MSIQYNLTANNGQFTEPVAIMSNTKVTTTNGYIQWAPNTLSDYKNNNVVWQNWPIGFLSGNAISLNQMIIRLVATSDGATAVVDQGNKGAANFGSVPSNAYWLSGSVIYTQSSTTNKISPLNSSINITTASASHRGVAHRGGWPVGTIPQQMLGFSVWDVEPGSNYRIWYVGAFSYQENAARTGTVQTLAEIPLGSGNWVTVTFNASVDGTFSQAGTTPAAENNWYLLTSDPIPVTLSTRSKIRIVTSSLGTFPVMSNYDGYLDGYSSLEGTLTTQSASATALQVNNLGSVKVQKIVDTIETEGATGFRVATGASWAAGVLTINCSAHNIASATNNRVVLSGWVSGVDINNAYAFSLNGTNAINITMSDPGVISEIGNFRVTQAITTASWSGGLTTFNRVAHGFIEGQIIAVRGATSTGVSVNGDWPLAAVTADSYSINMPVTAGTITTTNAYAYSKYSVSSTDFHLRPYTISADSNIACIAINSDSTTQTTGRIMDSTRLCGVGQRCVGELFPFVDMSANNEGLSHWLAFPGQVIIREKVMELLCQGSNMGYSKNDEPTSSFPTLADWTNGHDAWWERPVQKSLSTSGFNFAVKAPSGLTTTRDGYATEVGQLKPTGRRLLDFQEYLDSKVGTLYRRTFDYISLLTVLNQPYIYQCNDRLKQVNFAMDGTTAVITVSGSILLSAEDNGQFVELPGAGDSAAILYARIAYVSPTKAIAMRVSSGRMLPQVSTTAVVSGTATIGVNKYVLGTSSIHENYLAQGQITSAGLGLKQPGLS